jgi:hypothetical protein
MTAGMLLRPRPSAGFIEPSIRNPVMKAFLLLVGLNRRRGVYILTAALGVFIVAFVLKWGLA